MAVYSMKKTVIAILNHSVKAKGSAKQHRFCPPGESSWCRQQQDQASGTSTYKNDDYLPEIFLELLRPTFMTLMPCLDLNGLPRYQSSLTKVNIFCV